MQLLRLSIISAIRSLRRNVLRAGLSVLGISIGVAAVIGIVGIGEGASRKLEDQIQVMGRDLIIIYPEKRSSSGARSTARNIHTLTVRDALAIRNEVPRLLAVTYSRGKLVQTIQGKRHWSTQMEGTTPEYEEIMNAPVDRGRFFTALEEQTAARVVVLGPTVAEELFGEHTNPVGNTLRVSQVPFTVVGVFKAKGKAPWGQDRDDLVVVPFTTATRRILNNPFPGSVSRILISARNAEAVKPVRKSVEALLTSRHQIRGTKPRDFGIDTLATYIEMANTTAGIMTALVSAIGSVALLVGGVGIMNILLVSVTERTREIGVRMAVGAKRRHILTQFLVEGTVLSTVGGIIGIGLGILATLLAAALANWPVAIPPLAIVGAVLFSAAIGIFFGYYPARQAANLDPIEALRYE